MHSDEDGSYEASFAINAETIIQCLLAFLDSGEVALMVLAAREAIDCAFQLAEKLADEAGRTNLSIEEIDAEPLVLQELRRQQRDVDAIRSPSRGVAELHARRGTESLLVLAE